MKGDRLYQILVGCLLLVFGVILLLQTLGVLGPFTGRIWPTVWALLLGSVGLGFLVAFVSSPRTRWSAAIPALTLLGLSTLVLFGQRIGAPAGGLFLAAIGLGFVLVFLARPDFFWPIIPTGVLLTLAVVAWLGASAETWVPAILFLGIAGTFLVVYAMPGTDGRRRWALWPATIMGGMGILFSLGASGWMGYIVPVAVIIAGLSLVIRSLLRAR